MKIILVFLALVRLSVAQECNKNYSNSSTGGCYICSEHGHLKDESLLVTVDDLEGIKETTATCGVWWLFGCNFAESNVCSFLQSGDCGTNCCTREGPTPVAPSFTDSPTKYCQRNVTNCDICPGDMVVNDSKVVTVNSTTATCVEWFLFACTFVQPSDCAYYQVNLIDCCLVVPSPAPTFTSSCGVQLVLANSMIVLIAVSMIITGI